MIFAGIDVSKAQLDVAVRAGTEELWSTPNDPAGIRSLTERLLAHSPALVVLEATGGFEIAVTAALALFAERVRPEVRPLPDAAAQELQAVLTRRRQIIEMITAEKNRLGFATAAQVRRGIEKYIRWLEKQLQEINSDLDRHIRHSPLWRAKDDLCPGSGPIYLAPSLQSYPSSAASPVKKLPPWSALLHWPETAAHSVASA